MTKCEFICNVFFLVYALPRVALVNILNVLGISRVPVL